MNLHDAPIYSRQPWAKARPRRQRGPESIHLLEHHLADVGACFEALLEQPTIRQRLAHSGGLDSLDDATIARLSLFAALHDIGKVNIGFQTQVWREEDYPPGQRKPSRAGHTLDLAPVLNGDDEETYKWFFEALGWWDEAISWDSDDGKAVCGIFIAALSHHGRPLQLEGTHSRNTRIWQPYGRMSPEESVRRIGYFARRWFPSAFNPAAPPLPSAPAFQHHFLGLCNLADWIGSDEQWFPYYSDPDDDYISAARQKARRAIAEIGLNISNQRETPPDAFPSFRSLFDFSSPNAIQQETQETHLEAPLVIIESETGSGKTEAALWRFARMYHARLVDGLYFALPTRAAASQIHGRVKSFVARMFPDGNFPEPVLAIPGYLRAGDAAGRHLPDYEVWWDNHAADGRRWAAESPKRFLSAQIAVGTIDQAMLGALKVKNAHLRSSSLARNLLVVDEVHASDVYMSEVLKRLLEAHANAGGYALLMSATLGSSARQRWLRRGGRYDSGPSLNEAIAAPYPAVSVQSPDGESIADAGENGQDKAVHIAAIPEMSDFAAVAGRALTAARAGAKALVIRNTVGHAVSTQQALQELAGPGDAGLLFAVKGTPSLHHGRFAAADRELLDQRVEELLGKGRPPGGCVVIGTQTLEQSLDIDADLLITDLCPADVLLQRIGRLHRHRGNVRPADYAQPSCIVLTPLDNDLAPLLKRGQNPNGLGPHGYVYHSLQILEATRRLIASHSQWRIPEMNRELVERATHKEALDAITQEMGDVWRKHANETEGDYFAETGIANISTINFHKSFYADNKDILFPSDEERIRTRLGDDRIDLHFASPPASPLDQSRTIDRIAAPSRWLGSQEIPGTVQPTPVDGGFEFSVGDRKFRYDRLGLRRA